MRIARSLTAGVLGFACLWVACVKAPDIPFAPAKAEDAGKQDLEQVETQFPLAAEDRQRIDPDNVQKLNQAQIDQIYARITAGPIPDGAWNGQFFFSEGGGAGRLSEAVEGLPRLAIDIELDKLTAIGEMLWKGKRFFRDEMVLRNMIQNERLLQRVLDFEIPDANKMELDGRQVGLLFPAKLYCGESLLDDRRESVIIDYADNDQIENYLEKVDSLVGRKGLDIRDEIRMVRPGFYLGRAYFGTTFVLNFTLLNEEIEKRDGKAWLDSGGRYPEDCDPGKGPI